MGTGDDFGIEVDEWALVLVGIVSADYGGSVDRYNCSLERRVVDYRIETDDERHDNDRFGKREVIGRKLDGWDRLMMRSRCFLDADL